VKRVIFRFLGVILVGGGWTDSTTAAAVVSWEDKVDPGVLASAQSGETEFLVILRDQVDLSAAASLESKLEKGTFVFETLSQFAATTQKPIRAFLDAAGVEYHSFWIVNMLWVRGDALILEQIAQRDDVRGIRPNPVVKLDEPEISQAAAPLAISGIEWNISQIEAPLVWNLGYTGEGIIIGGQDTGYDWDHPALKEQYRGWDGASADHNYNWHDTVTSGGGICGPNTLEPCDDHGHGTHTMGTMVGDDADTIGGTNQIGVAPGARWIGCRNMNVGVGTPASYAECYQWFIAPTDLNNEHPEPSKAPHVINNSWGCPTSEGCTEPDVLLAVVQAVRAAGIVTVHSAGNSGPFCETVDEPAAIYAESFTIGATDSSDVIASFSSRGPVTVDLSNRLKPNVSAPGVSIRSSTLGGGYGIKSGTSMAGPHVTGLVALLLSANPGLIGQVSEIETIIEQTALPRTTTQTCGNVPGSQIPNNTYGWGRVDAWAAVRSTLVIFYFPIMMK
jgi:serine protease AprX